MSSQMMFGQLTDLSLIDPTFNDYFIKNINSKKAYEYQDIEGSPYLNSEFMDGVLYLKDSTAVKLPLRYNIYTDEMEYQLKGSNYSVGNPQSLNKILLGESVFVYLPFIQKGGYFELFELGNCFLVQKKMLKFNPAESAKPIVGVAIPAKFIRERDIFYMVVNHSQAFKIVNMKAVINALQDQKLKIENFIKQEKIKNTKKENLIKIVKYYNSL
jgi:hypothetical protein